MTASASRAARFASVFVEERPRFPLSPEERARELAERLPHVPEAARALAEFYSTRRSDLYHQYAVKQGDGAWRPAQEQFSVGALRASLRGDPTDGPDDRGCGRYCLNDDDTTDWLAFDVDAHKKGETAEGPAYALARELAVMGFDFLLSRSSGGRGFHIALKFDRSVPGYLAINLAAWVKRRAGVSPKLEVFPKGPRLGRPDPSSGSKPAGAQIAVPGCLNFYAKSGGGAVLRRDFSEVPFAEVAAHVRSVRRIDVDALMALCVQVESLPEEARAREQWRDIRQEHAVVSHSHAREHIAGEPMFSSVGELAEWARAHGCDGRIKNESVVTLHRCPGNEHGSKRADGAALILRRDGTAWFKCHHAACEYFHWEHLLAKWGVVVDAAEATADAPAPVYGSAPAPAPEARPRPPIPGPGYDPATAHVPQGAKEHRFVERTYLSAEHRDLASAWSRRGEVFSENVIEDPRTAGMRLRVRRAGVCGLLGTETCGVCCGGPGHPAHGAVVTHRFACGCRTLCASCAACFAEELARTVVSEYDEKGISIARFTVAEGDVRERWAAITKMRKRLTKTVGGVGEAYRWLQGTRTLIVALDEYGRRMLAGALRREPIEGVTLEHYDDPHDAAQQIADCYMEPALEFRRCLAEYDREGFLSLMDLFTDKLRRSDGSRRRQLAWLTEAEADEAALAKAEERRQKHDGKHCPRTVEIRPDGTMPPPVELSWVVRAGGRVVYQGMPGTPRWKVEKWAFAALADWKACGAAPLASSA